MATLFFLWGPLGRREHFRVYDAVNCDCDPFTDAMAGNSLGASLGGILFVFAFIYAKLMVSTPLV